jgi:hypothetical protein
MLLLLAALPALYWDSPPETAASLRDAGITHVVVPAAQAEGWKTVAGISVEVGDPQKAVKLQPPAVNYRMNQGGATRSPWLVSNGWRFLRQPEARFYYDMRGPQAALAAAEAFCFGATAMIRTDVAGLKPLAEMLAFLRAVPPGDLPPVADIGFVDDGSFTSGEVMNMMVRGNLQFRIVPAADRSVKLTVRLGSKEYPLERAKNPGAMAQEIRARLTDEKRSVRVYGSQVVVARLTARGARARLHLLNYAGAERRVDGIRVRVAGRYEKHGLMVAGSPEVKLADYTIEPDATEFTLPELRSYAIIDLDR